MAIFSKSTETQVRRKTRTPEQRRADFCRCDECDGCGQTTRDNPNDPWARVRTCASCRGTGENEMRADWDAAMALWNATPDGPDGDERYAAVWRAFGRDLAEALATMESECGVVR